MRRWNVFALDQCLSTDGAALLPFSVIADRCHGSSTGRTPLWYLYLRNKLTDYATSSSLKLCRPVHFTPIPYDPSSAVIAFSRSPPIAIDDYYQRFKRYWICCMDSALSEINFYRGFCTSSDLTSVKSAHWRLAPPTKLKRNAQGFSPESGFMTLSPCPGCDRHDNSLTYPSRVKGPLTCISNIILTSATILQDGPRHATKEAVFPFSYRDLVPLLKQFHLYDAPAILPPPRDLPTLPPVLHDDNLPLIHASKFSQSVVDIKSKLDDLFYDELLHVYIDGSYIEAPNHSINEQSMDVALSGIHNIIHPLL